MTATINIERLWDQHYRDASVPFPVDGFTTGGAINAPWLDVTDGPFNADPTGATDSSAAFNTLVSTLAAGGGRRSGFIPNTSGSAMYRVADVWMASNVTLFIEDGVTFKFPPFVDVATTDPAVFRLLTSDRTLTSYLAGIRIIGLGTWTIDLTDVPDGTYSGIPRGIHVLNCQDYEITNVNGVGMGSAAGNTVIISNNQSNIASKHGRFENIGSHGVRGIGSSCIQVEAGYDIEAVGLYADGGVPARIETDGNTGGVAENIRLRLIRLTNESGFANHAGYFVAHTNTIRNCSISDFVVPASCPANGIQVAYDSGGVIDGVAASDGLVLGGGYGVRAFIASDLVDYPSFPRSTFSRIRTDACGWNQAFTIADGLTYRDCYAENGTTPGWGASLVQGSSTTPTPIAGSVCHISGGRALCNSGVGVDADGVERVVLIGFESHDLQSRIDTSPGSELVTNTGFETNTTGWTAKQNCTIARTTSQHNTGSASLQITPTASSSFAAVRTATGTGGGAVTAGDLYEFSAYFKAGGGSALFCGTAVQWYDSSGASIIADPGVSGPSVQTNTSTWVQATLIATAPVTAAFATILLQVYGLTSTGDVHYVDDASLKDVTGTALQVYGASVASNTTLVLAGGTDLSRNKTGRFLSSGTVVEATLATVTS